MGHVVNFSKQINKPACWRNPEERRCVGTGVVENAINYVFVFPVLFDLDLLCMVTHRTSVEMGEPSFSIDLFLRYFTLLPRNRAAIIDPEFLEIIASPPSFSSTWPEQAVHSLCHRMNPQRIMAR
jgi:hypothetical protein